MRATRGQTPAGRTRPDAGAQVRAPTGSVVSPTSGYTAPPRRGRAIGLLEETLTPVLASIPIKWRSTARPVGVEGLVDPVASGPGQRIESPAHVRERWERSVPTAVAAPPKGCHITFTEAVQVRPLAVYAEVAS